MSSTAPVGVVDRMSDFDALMWTVERNPHLRSPMTSVAVFDGALDRDAVRARFERLTRVIPRFRQRVRPSPLGLAPPQWDHDPDFDLDHHLRWRPAGGTRDLAEVLAVAAPLIAEGFDRDRPLWRAEVIEDIADGTTAMILETHHAVVDGLGAIRMQTELFDFEPDPAGEPMPAVPAGHPSSTVQRSLDAVAHELRSHRAAVERGRDFLRSNLLDPVGTGRGLIDQLASARRLLEPADRPMSPLMADRSTEVRLGVVALRLPDLKAAARRVDAKLNDAFLAGLCLGLRRHHHRAGRPVDALRFAVPVNQRRPDDDAAGNHWAPVRFVVPLVDDPDEQMAIIAERMAAGTGEPALGWLGALAAMVRRLPAPMATAIAATAMRGTDVQASNVPGSPLPMYLAGVPMIAQYPFGAVLTSALNVTLLSYGEDLHLGVAMNAAAITDPDGLIDDLGAGFATVIG